MYPEAVSRLSDAVSHYCTSGWREGKNPIDWFDTRYYLATNKDVAAQGINPFWHYLVAGMSEGRHSRQPAGYRRQIIDNAASPDEVTSTYVAPLAKEISARELEKRLQANATTRAGLALSLSHDRYTSVTGGIQLFISDEQGQFAGRNIQYLNISPAQPLLHLAHPDDRGLMVNLILDGHFMGVASYDTLIRILKLVPPQPMEQRLFLVHSLFGHAVQEVIALHDALYSGANFFWIHDYSSLCVGYTLLRNDVAFCKAPPPESLICRICIYGERRPSHLSQLQTLFEAIAFQVVAPSHAALQVWQEHTKLPHKSASVHPHCDLVFADDLSVAETEGGTIRVAFIGFPRAHKGWPLWQEIVSRTWQRGVYQFLHFGTPETAQSSLHTKHHNVSTSAEDPDAMIKALAEFEVDLVLILSTWPETFSYTTYEALAAGGDIVCLADSGNVADMVRRHARGYVANSELDLFAFFESDQAIDYVARSRAKGRQRARVIRNGTTATFLHVAATA
jgi:glycosyltransferase involved in cell wall biosynthesis